MKKIFLSLAALAFVATGTLSVVSCQSDDTPGVPLPQITDNAGEAVYKGVSYRLDTSRILLKGDNQGPKPMNYTTPSGEQITVYKWRIDSWDGSVQNISKAKNLSTIEFYVPATEDGKYQFPNEAGELYPVSYQITLDGKQINLGDVAIDTKVYNIVTTAGKKSVSYYSSFKNKDKEVLSLSFEGTLVDVFLY